MKIYLIYGGKSAEHDISILTAHSIIKGSISTIMKLCPFISPRQAHGSRGNLS